MAQGSRRLFVLSDANTAHTERWIAALSKRGYDLLLFSLTVPDSRSLLEIPRVRFETARVSADIAYSKEGSARKLTYLRALPAIKRLARQFDPQICHAHYASSYGVLAALAKLPRFVLSIWGADVYNTPRRSFLHRLIVAQTIKAADIVLSTSQTMRRQGLQLCRRDIGVVPFGIDTNRFAPTRTSRGRVITVGTVKSLEDKYGIDFLLRAFALARRELKSCELRLLIVGGGSRRSHLEELARELEISDATTFAGRIEYSQASKMHNELDIAVFPSIEDSESFGVSVIEAQACERPVIVSNVGGLPEVVRVGESAIVAPARDTTALAQAICELASDPVRAAAMGRAGRKHVIENYDLDHCVELLESYYSKVTG